MQPDRDRQLEAIAQIRGDLGPPVDLEALQASDVEQLAGIGPERAAVAVEGKQPADLIRDRVRLVAGAVDEKPPLEPVEEQEDMADADLGVDLPPASQSNRPPAPPAGWSNRMASSS